MRDVVRRTYEGYWPPLLRKPSIFFLKGALDKFWSALMHKSQIYGTFIFPFCDIWRLGKRMHPYAYVFFIQIPHIHYSCIHTASVWISQLFLIYGILNSQLSSKSSFDSFLKKTLTIRLYVRHCVGPFAFLSIRLSVCLFHPPSLSSASRYKIP